MSTWGRLFGRWLWLYRWPWLAVIVVLGLAIGLQFVGDSSAIDTLISGEVVIGFALAIAVNIRGTHVWTGDATALLLIFTGDLGLYGGVVFLPHIGVMVPYPGVVLDVVRASLMVGTSLFTWVSLGWLTDDYKTRNGDDGGE